VPVKSGVSAANLEQSLKDAATSNGLLLIGESPIYKQIEAITGKAYRYVNFLSFGDAELMKSLLDYSDRYAAFFPLRIAVVEDREGKLWLHGQNLDILIQAGDGLSSAAQDAALELQDRVRKTINAVPLAESNAIPLATVAVNKLGDSVQNPRNQDGQQTNSDNDNSSSSGKSDAYMAAKQFLESKYLKCGDVYVAADKATGLRWTLIAGVEFDFREQELSKADRMNGLTLKGEARLGKDAAYRYLYGDRNFGVVQWFKYNEWAPANETLLFELQNGKWEARNAPNSLQGIQFGDGMEKPSSCKDIPQAIREEMR
jgi:uncharacterized protein (DUF302 family)